jgi:hypothetical protein
MDILLFAFFVVRVLHRGIAWRTLVRRNPDR